LVIAAIFLLITGMFIGQVRLQAPSSLQVDSSRRMLKMRKRLNIPNTARMDKHIYTTGVQ
jgi:hypothetical protein